MCSRTKRSGRWYSRFETDTVKVADLTATDFRLNRPADVLELVGSGTDRAVIHEQQINPEFFDLSSGFAGEVVQKCQNYGLRVAVVVEPGKTRSTHFQQFAGESNRQNRFVFVATVAEALERLRA